MVGPRPLLSDRVLSLAERHRHKLFVALAGLYLLGINGDWRLEPDSALYLNIGRNLANGLGYTYHGEAHHLAFPGLPVMFAGVFKLFHTSRPEPLLGIMMLIGAATLGLTYRLFLLHAGRPTAVLMTFGLGISRLFYRYCFELLSDMPFLLGVMAFLVGYEAVFQRRQIDQRDAGAAARARWYDWVLLVGGLALAVAMRPAMWALLMAIVLAMGWSTIRGPRRWPQLVGCLAVVGVGILFWKIDPRHAGNYSMGQYEDQLFDSTLPHLGLLFHQMFFEYIPRLFEATLCQALFGCRLGAGLNTIAGIAVLAVGASLFWQRPLWGLWIVMTIAMMLVAVKPLDRYFLEVQPLLVYGWWHGIRWLNQRLGGPWGNRLFLALFMLGGVTNLCRTGEFIIEQRQVPFLDHYKEGRYASTTKVARVVREHVGAGDWVLAPPKFARILTFLSHRKAVEPVPQTRLDPARQVVYVLEPLDDPVRGWLSQAGASLGPPIGPSAQSAYDTAPWRLHRVIARP